MSAQRNVDTDVHGGPKSKLFLPSDAL